jgi:glucan 1,4-alpha-maltotetraohydrolase
MTRNQTASSCRKALLATILIGLPTSASAYKFTWTPIDAKPITVHFRCANGHTQQGDSVYVVGSSPELGRWDPARAVRLTDTSQYPIWQGDIPLPPGQVLEWKCIIRSESDPKLVKSWQADPNNRLTVAVGAKAEGSF